MNPLLPMSYVPNLVVARVADRVSAWAVESQQGARRNALVANTALAARRAERQDVEAFFAGRKQRPTLPATAHR